MFQILWEFKVRSCEIEENCAKTNKRWAGSWVAESKGACSDPQEMLMSVGAKETLPGGIAGGGIAGGGMQAY